MALLIKQPQRSRTGFSVAEHTQADMSTVDCIHVPSTRLGLEITPRSGGSAVHLPPDIVLMICKHLKNIEEQTGERSKARIACKELMLGFLDADTIRESRKMSEAWILHAKALVIPPESSGYGDILKIVNIVPCILAQLPAIACFSGKRIARSTFEFNELLSTHFLENAEHVEILREILWDVFDQRHIHVESRDVSTGSIHMKMRYPGSKFEIRMTLQKSQTVNDAATDVLVSFVEPQDEEEVPRTSVVVSPLKCIDHMLFMVDDLSPGAAADIAFTVRDYLVKWDQDTIIPDSSPFLSASSSCETGRCTVFMSTASQETLVDLAGAICVAVSTLLGAEPKGGVRLLAFGQNREGVLITGVSCDAGSSGTGFVSCSLSLANDFLDININFAEVVPCFRAPNALLGFY